MVFIACSSYSKDRSTVLEKEYSVEKTESAIIIDGKDNEPSWQNAKLSSQFVDILSGKNAQFATNFKCVRDEENVYFFIKLEEPHIRGYMTTRDTTLYNENCFEIFIDPDNDGENYLELEINARGTIFDLVIDRPYKKEGSANKSYDIKGLKHRTNIEGTINDPNDTDDFWAIEISIPLSSIFELSKHKSDASKFAWRVHMARMQFPSNLHEGEYQSDPKVLPKVWVWNKQSAFDNHLPEEWGWFVFE